MRRHCRTIEQVFYSDPMRQPPFHVWVDLTNSWSSPEPGVLLAWRRTTRPAGGWEAWVMWASAFSTGDGLEVQVTQSWVLAHLVRPADQA